jgi:hypothetical protein
MAVVLLSDVKTFLNITSTGNDAELADMVGRAEAVIATRVGPLAPVTVTEMHHGGANPIILRRPPVISVTSVVAGGVTTVSGFDLDPGAGLLFSESGYGVAGLPRSVQVTYMSGRDALPADLEAAVLELVKHLWISQRPAGAQAPPGSLAGEDVQPGGSYLLPYRVQSLIEPHLLPAVA